MDVTFKTMMTIATVTLVIVASYVVYQLITKTRLTFT